MNRMQRNSRGGVASMAQMALWACLALVSSRALKQSSAPAPAAAVAAAPVIARYSGKRQSYYDGTFRPMSMLAPASWLLFVWCCMVGFLYLVGYLSKDVGDPLGVLEDLKAISADPAQARAALGFSGVTLAITVALAVTGLFWSLMAGLGTALRYGGAAVFVAAVVLAISIKLALLSTAPMLSPFTGELGKELLKLAVAGIKDPPLPDGISPLMFGLACVVPSVLLAGATFLLQPMENVTHPQDILEQARQLSKRLRELDQMLYIGGLALVFGTLQLSAGLSGPLAKLPKLAEIKGAADLCKTMTTSGGLVVPFAPIRPAVAPSAPPIGPKISTFDEECQKLPDMAAKLGAADSLRQFVRGVTLCFGLAYSALLTAIYVPALMVLRNRIEPMLLLVPKELKPDVTSVDPVSRIGAVIATLSPLFAGLLANILVAG